MKPFQTARDYLRMQETIYDCRRLYKTSGDYLRLQKAIKGMVPHSTKVMEGGGQGVQKSFSRTPRTDPFNQWSKLNYKISSLHAN